jgi:hypothetical protein
MLTLLDESKLERLQIPGGKNLMFPYNFSMSFPYTAAKLQVKNGNNPATLLLRRQNMNIKKLLTLVGALAIRVAALLAGAAIFA